MQIQNKCKKTQNMKAVKERMVFTGVDHVYTRTKHFCQMKEVFQLKEHYKHFKLLKVDRCCLKSCTAVG